MFETVGKEDKRPLREQLTAMGFSIGMWSSLIGALVVAGREVAQVVEDEKPVEVTFYDAAPPPPPPPPPAGGGSKPKTEKKPKDPDPEPVEPDPDPTPDPEPTPAPEPEASPEPAGVEGGVVGGVEGGVVGGVVGGVIGGQLGGQLGGTGTKAVHWSAVTAKSRSIPDYPEAARALGLGEETCVVKMQIDEKGKPTEVAVEKCSAAFHEETRRAALQWRFYPYKEGGKAMPASFTLTIKYQPKK
jgi:protein TonB